MSRPPVDLWDTTWMHGDTILHVTPPGDLLGHEHEPQCACLPYVEAIGNGEAVVMHNAWDGRS